MTMIKSGPIDTGGIGYFQARPIDDVPQLLDKSYSLRYQVYCLERKFLRAEDYPQGLEIDEFDRHSIHVGAVDARGELAGTARAVKISEIGLPLFRHCTTFPDEMERHPPTTRLVEVGRLSVSRSYRRRTDDDAYGVTTVSPSDSAAEPPRGAGAASATVCSRRCSRRCIRRPNGSARRTGWRRWRNRWNTCSPSTDFRSG